MSRESNMKKALCLLIVAVYLSGCMGGRIKAPVANLEKIRTIGVVAMEAPPLEVPPSLSSSALFAAGTSIMVVPEQSLQTGGRVAVMVSGVLMLLELPEAMRNSAKVANSFDAMLAAGDAWLPTAVLAREAAGQIAAGGRYAVVAKDGLQPLAGLNNRERTFFGENWMAPLRDWYDQGFSRTTYRSLQQEGIDAVLEVGLLNYALYRDNLMLQVCLKLVDPATGSVLGRAKAVDYREIAGSGLFNDNGSSFKRLFLDIGNKLLTEDLKDIGLILE